MATWLVGLGGVIAGLAWFLAMAVQEWGAWALVLPGRRAGALAEAMGPRPPSEWSPLEARAADGVRLAGVWSPAAVARDAGPSRGVVLLIRGFAEGPPARRVRTEFLNAAGWDVAALDSRAHGRSGGDRGSFGGREGADIHSWIDALIQSGRIDPARPIVIWGRSMGAAIAVRAAADDPRIAALVLEAPYVDLETTLAGVLHRRWVPLPRLAARAVLRRARRLAGVALAQPRPIDLAPRLKLPALVAHGSADRLIPASEAHRLAAAFGRPAESFEIAGAGHSDLVEVGGASFLNAVVAFLDRACEDPRLSLRRAGSA